MKPAAHQHRGDFIRLEQLRNVGPAVASDLRLLGIVHPRDLIGRDPYAMFEDLCRTTGKRHDPCMLDTFIAIVRCMEGEPARPWFAYTAERKRALRKRIDEPTVAWAGGPCNRSPGDL